MRALTEKEKTIVLLIAKNFTESYNARSLSRYVGMSPRGTLKALKFLEYNGILISKHIGKAIIYHLVFNEYAKKLLALFLFEEAQAKASRWVKEFENFKKVSALILFGSVLRTKQSKDIDVLILIEKKNYSGINKLVEEKNAILVKPLHPIWQTCRDLRENLKKHDSVVLEILKEGIVIMGHDIIVEALADAARS